jgi:hypothetical protein
LIQSFDDLLKYHAPVEWFSMNVPSGWVKS